MNQQELGLIEQDSIDAARIRESLSFAERAQAFCESPPHREAPYSARNWGGQLHSLCSYQGKLKPAIAHFLVEWFSEPGQVVLDPLSGVGTIPLEARRTGRIALANDLSPLAAIVSRAKTEPYDPARVSELRAELGDAVSGAAADETLAFEDTEFGLNRPIREYFHEATLREVLAARSFFLHRVGDSQRSSLDVLWANALHILHGNRPYALSRRSHPITPFAPRGEYEYRPFLARLDSRLERVMPSLETLNHSPVGCTYEGDFRSILRSDVDVVITSPPFTKSLRFWSSNWMRLWFSGWSPDDFKVLPASFLETEQKTDLTVYDDLIRSAAGWLKPGGKLILHLGETATLNMAHELEPLVTKHFRIDHIGAEGVTDTESHGLTDKGATVAHWYVFATAL